MKDEIINHILLKINNSVEYRFLKDKSDQFDDSEYTKHFIFMLKELGLIKAELEKADIFTLTSFGYDVVKKGGWIKHLEMEIESKKNIEIKL